MLHEVLVDLFRQRPELVADLLRTTMADPLPEFDQARTESGDFPDINPTEYRADAVIVLAKDNNPSLAVVVEIQLQPDSDKSWSWPVYVTTLRGRLRCPTVLLVLCANNRTAGHCRIPIVIGPGCTLTPIVLSPANVPVITDRDTFMANPELAALSVIAHQRGPDRDRVLTAFAEHIVDLPQHEMYIDLVVAALTKVARHFLEGQMTSGTYTFKSDFVRRYFAEAKAAGEVEGEVEALLTFLRARFTVSEAVIAQVTACADTEQLKLWIERAATAESIDKVFEE